MPQGSWDSEPEQELWEGRELVKHWGTSNPTFGYKPVPFYTGPREELDTALH